MILEIKVLGSGCAKCKQLHRLVETVVEENNFNATVTKVEDIVEIMNYGIMITPGLVINNKVVLKGYVPSKEELKKVIEDNSNE